MSKPLNLIGIGVGPFNLSLAALLEKANGLTSLFLEKKSQFDWHPEVMFKDSVMQTSYLKDLVTPVDPTSPYSFLNYLNAKNLFYPFLNTQRTTVSRKEFEQYCVWAAESLGQKLKFNTEVQSIDFKNDLFHVQTSTGEYQSQNICIATGLVPRIPEGAKKLIGPKVFHAKSAFMKDLNLAGKSVLIVGGGQTGIEVFRNALHGKWGHASAVKIITRRKSLEPLDESAFTNEYFTPNYVEKFWELNLDKKSTIVASQKLASDGNTPSYLLQLYNDLYRLKYVENDSRPIQIMACRKLVSMVSEAGSFRLGLQNLFYDQPEEISADIVILCTGFQSTIPKALDPLISHISLDSESRFQFKKSYSVQWDGPKENRIYALNFSRHNHGIIDPQTSLMAWRSAVVINDLANEKIYQTEQMHENFVEYGENKKV